MEGRYAVNEVPREAEKHAIHSPKYVPVNRYVTDFHKNDVESVTINAQDESLLAYEICVTG